MLLDSAALSGCGMAMLKPDLLDLGTLMSIYKLVKLEKYASAEFSMLECDYVFAHAQPGHPFKQPRSRTSFAGSRA